MWNSIKSFIKSMNKQDGITTTDDWIQSDNFLNLYIADR